MRRLNILNNYLIIVLCVTLLFFSTLAISNQDGITGYSGNPSQGKVNCSSNVGCHSGGIPPTVKIQGPAQVLIGSKNNHFKLTMQNGQDKIGGLNISVDSGNLFIRDGNTRLDPASLEITHIAPAKPVMLDGTTITWLFDWDAPTDGTTTSTIYAALISADKNADAANDSVKTVSMQVEVVTQLTMEPKLPKAVITAPFSAPVGVAVPLIASKSSVSEGMILDHVWSYTINDFTFAIRDKGEQILKSFDSAGFYTITLTVTTDRKVSHSTYFDILVTDKILNDKNSELIPFANISAPKTGIVGQAVTFSGDQSKPTTVASYFWDFGDGKSETDPSAILKVGVPNTNYTYTAAGTYTVTLAVQGINSLTDVDTFEIIITDGSGAAQKVLTGEQLFTNADTTTATTTCTGASCHGVAGIANGAVKNIKGASRDLIETAIAGTNNVLPLMVARIDNVRSLDSIGTQKIADYLGTVVLPDLPQPLSTVDKENQGKLLYEARCLLCHGVAADGVNTRGRNIQGFTQATILDAINQVVTVVPPKNAIPLMKGINLSAIEAEYIEFYLATLLAPITGNLVAGETTFDQKCSFCHGTGTGGYAISVIGASVQNITNFLSNQTEMQNIKLTAVEKLDIESFLVAGELPIPSTGAGLYAMYCSYCHGIDGAGGPVAKKDIRNNNKFDAKFIQKSYKPLKAGAVPKPATIVIMNSTNLNDKSVTALNDPVTGIINLQLIADFLNPPVAAVGAIQ